MARGKHYKHPVVVDHEVFNQSKEGMKGLVGKRTRASFYKSLEQLEHIASGEAVSTSTSETTSPDGKVTRTVTKTLPSAKDRIAAITALGKYGGLDPDQKQGGMGQDLQVVVRALVEALREPGVRDALLAEPGNREILRLLAAEEVDVEGDGMLDAGTTSPQEAATEEDRP